MSLGLILFVLFLSLLPIFFSTWFSNLLEEFYDWEKSSPYECGFIATRSPGDFSSRFFHLVILFLVWDVEIVLLVPCFHDLLVWSVGALGATGFILVLIYGLYYEIVEGTIKWTLHMS